MTPGALRTWSWLHTWSSLVCTAFMLLLCVTGLPLIFQHEIAHLSGSQVEPAELPADTPRVPLDEVIAAARAVHPDRVVQYVSQEADDDRLWWITLTPTPAPTLDYRSVAVDARTARIVGDTHDGKGFMGVMLRLHVDMFAGQTGKLFLGAMGLLLLLAIVSGVVLYAPFMRKLSFGQVRHGRSRRIRWLDLHNLSGIVTLAWFSVVAATGVMNTVDDLIYGAWRASDLAPLLSRHNGEQPVPETERAPIQRSLQAALAHAPGMKVNFIAFPGTEFSSPAHHTFYLRGDTRLTSHLLQPVLVDSRSARVTDSPSRPWYLSALQLSRPLHFGDYAGMPMKILWALLDLATIIVLSSGLYLWIARKLRARERRAGMPVQPAAQTTASRRSP